MALVRAQKATKGLTVITNEQTAGRGQHGNTWMSAPNLNLTFSVIFFPESLNLKDSFLLNIISSLAVAKTVEEYLPKDAAVCVKWPNDIYVNSKKIAGILVENTIRGEHVHAVVIGIGLNVNQIAIDLPHASSMVQECSKTFDLQNILNRLCENLELNYLLLEENKTQELQASYHNSLFGLNTSLNYTDNEGDFVGIVRGITQTGALQIEKSTGVLKTYALKEIQFKNKI
jgi:BirA family transcriptional regulator, biotin operon repressor / biotin---[acetyl-CoA-carboxylase] ligase